MSKGTLFVLAASTVLAAAAGALAEPPGPYLESATYPIRVFHDDDTADAAIEVLAAAEAAWVAQVEELGFAPPLRQVGVDDDVQEGLDIVLDTGLPGVAAYEIEGNNLETPSADCPTFGFINSDYMTSAEMLEMTTVHVLNHGSLHAVDCIEPVAPAYDMFAVATEVVVMGTDHFYWLMSELPAFQAHPWFSLDQVSSAEVFYAYGSGFFLMFLDEVYGGGDGALLPAIWERTAQDGNLTSWAGGTCSADVENEPDYFDAIAAELETQSASFDEAFVLFTEYRFFVGNDADGAHLGGADGWSGSEVARDTQLTVADLPLEGGAPAFDVAEYGASYVEIDPAGLPSPQAATISFAGNPAKAWAASLFLVPADGAATIVPIDLDADQEGEVAVEDASAWSLIVLAATNLGDGDHDPDATDWSTVDGDYEYSIATPGFDGDADAGADGGDADADTDTDADSGADAGQGAGSSGCGCAVVSGIETPSLIAALLDACL